MSAAWVLGAVQIGSALVTSLASAQSSDASAADARNELVQFQLDQRAESLTRQRRMYVTDLIGQQKAALGASGIAGGRTARLLEAQVRQRASHIAQVSKTNISNQRITSTARLGQAKYRRNVAQLGSRMSMFNAIAGAAASGASLYQGYQERQRALNGPTGDSGQFMSDGFTINY